MREMAVEAERGRMVGKGPKARRRSIKAAVAEGQELNR
jgi:hypothetical protein